MLAQGSDGLPVRPQSSLPCSRARIRFAYFVHLESLINHARLTQRLGQQLVTAYASLSSFVEDEHAKEINRVVRFVREEKLNLEALENRRYAAVVGDLSRFAGSVDAIQELATFIGECHARIASKKRTSVACRSIQP